MTDTDDIPDEMTLELRKPIKSPSGEELTELRLREPTAGELAQVARKSQDEAGIFMVAKCSGVPEGAIRQMAARDFKKAADYLLSFTPVGPKTGNDD